MVINQLQHGIGKVAMAPNRSASWRVNKVLIAGVGTVTLLVGSAWSLVGAWLVLPFAGLEVGVLAYVLYRVSRDSHRYEVLHVEPEQLRVETGVEFPSRSWRFQRAASFIRIVTPRHQLDSAAVYICSGDLQIELGAFLNPDDKRELIDALRTTSMVIKRVSAENQSFPA